MSSDLQRGRYWGSAAFQGNALYLGGQRLEPDLTKAYLEFRMAHAFHLTPEGTIGGRTAYGTATSAKTLANSYQSLLHQIVDLGHRVKSYDASPERDQIPRDYTLGSIVAAEYPPMPENGYPIKTPTDAAPHIHGAAVLHKQAEKVPHVLGEHLSGRHKWSVSLEMKFPHSKSGFIIHNRSKGTSKQRMAMHELSPVTWGATSLNDLDMGYIVVESAPDDLLKCYNGMDNRMVQQNWGDLPVTYLQGGWDGENHFMGMGVVRYPAEREAEIGQILAHDPDALDLLSEDPQVGVLKNYFQTVTGSLAQLVAACKK